MAIRPIVYNDEDQRHYPIEKLPSDIIKDFSESVLKVGGIPVGAIQYFAGSVAPEGYLKCDGAQFNKERYPELFQVLGSSYTPNLAKEDVGMLAYCVSDRIPEGWIYFDDIEREVTPQKYPELYNLLIKQYKSLSRVPKAENSFIRNYFRDGGAGISKGVGQKQDSGIPDMKWKIGEIENTYAHSSQGFAGSGYTRAHGSRNGLNEKGKEDALDNVVGEVVFSLAHDGQFKRDHNNTPYPRIPDDDKVQEVRPKAINFVLCIKAKQTTIPWIRATSIVLPPPTLTDEQSTMISNFIDSYKEKVNKILDEKLEGIKNLIIPIKRGDEVLEHLANLSDEAIKLKLNVPKTDVDPHKIVRFEFDATRLKYLMGGELYINYHSTPERDKNDKSGFVRLAVPVERKSEFSLFTQASKSLTKYSQIICGIQGTNKPEKKQYMYLIHTNSTTVTDITLVCDELVRNDVIPKDLVINIEYIDWNDSNEFDAETIEFLTKLFKDPTPMNKTVVEHKETIIKQGNCGTCSTRQPDPPDDNNDDDDDGGEDDSSSNDDNNSREPEKTEPATPTPSTPSTPSKPSTGSSSRRRGSTSSKQKGKQSGSTNTSTDQGTGDTSVHVGSASDPSYGGGDHTPESSKPGTVNKPSSGGTNLGPTGALSDTDKNMDGHSTGGVTNTNPEGNKKENKETSPESAPTGSAFDAVRD